MILPHDLRPKLGPLEEVVKKWPITVPFDRVISWILQFEPDDFDLGIRIINNLNILGPEEVRNGLQIAYSRLRRIARSRKTSISEKNTIFAAIGDAGKSGGFITYEFRLANSLPQSNFSLEDQGEYLSKQLVENVVLLDDVIGSGRTALREATKTVENVTPLGVKNVFVLSVCGFSGALEQILKKAGAHALSAFTYSTKDTVRCLDSSFYDGLEHEVRSGLLERLKYYNKSCGGNELGYGGVGALLAFRQNTPNISLPVIWASKNGWIPLLPRLGSLPGIDEVYRKIRKAQKNQAEEQKPAPNKAESVITILVEGKTDEMVLDFIISKYNIATRVGVKSLPTVSLGGVYASSDKLFTLLQNSGRHFILVLEDEKTTSEWLDQNKDNVNIPVCLLSPNIAALLDVPAALSFSGLPAAKQNELKSRSSAQEFMNYAERYLRSRGFGRTAGRTYEILNRFIDSGAVDKFICALSEGIAQLFPG